MKHVRILDVTLRDCALVNGWQFSSEQITGIVNALTTSGIDLIEVGYYLPGASQQRPLPPRPSYCPQEYLEELACMARASELAVMLRPKEVEISEIPALKKAGVALVRLPTLPHEVDSLTAHIDAIHTAGMECSINVIFGSQHTEMELLRAACMADRANADYFYVADTISAFLPQEIGSLYAKLRASVGCQLGFHAHDSRRLALANSLQAAANGAVLIDSSLAGMGSGGGNLITELLAAQRYAEGGPYCDLNLLAQAASLFLSDWIEHNPVQQLTYMMVALLNKNPIQVRELEDKAVRCGGSLHDLLLELLTRQYLASFSAQRPTENVV